MIWHVWSARTNQLSWVMKHWLPGRTLFRLFETWHKTKKPMTRFSPSECSYWPQGWPSENNVLPPSPHVYYWLLINTTPRVSDAQSICIMATHLGTSAAPNHKGRTTVIGDLASAVSLHEDVLLFVYRYVNHRDDGGGGDRCHAQGNTRSEEVGGEHDDSICIRLGSLEVMIVKVVSFRRIYFRVWDWSFGPKRAMRYYATNGLLLQIKRHMTPSYKTMNVDKVSLQSQNAVLWWTVEMSRKHVKLRCTVGWINSTRFRLLNISPIAILLWTKNVLDPFPCSTRWFWLWVFWLKECEMVVYAGMTGRNWEWYVTVVCQSHP